MFFPRRGEPLELEAEGLTGLRCSLNAPVIALPDLPVGPARAAIAVHLEPDGRPNVTVGVRCLKTGEVALYSYVDGQQGRYVDDPQGDQILSSRAEAAISFGESMGFLFDDDEFERSDAGLALGLWSRLVERGPLGEGTQLAASTEPGPGSLDTSEPDELLLEDLADPADAVVPIMDVEPTDISASVTDADLVISDSPERVAASPGPIALSKFRRLPVAGPSVLGTIEERPADLASNPASVPVERRSVPVERRSVPVERRSKTVPVSKERRQTALGRLKLVKRRRAGDVSRPGWVTKLLTSF